jgi:hypothetical protein
MRFFKFLPPRWLDIINNYDIITDMDTIAPQGAWIETKKNLTKLGPEKLPLAVLEKKLPRSGLEPRRGSRSPATCPS